MANALFAFEDCVAGQGAAEELVRRGLPQAAVQTHYDSAKRPGHSGEAIDEQITGGLITNLLDLFRGVIEWGQSPHDASAFEETIRRGGAVISVDAASEQEQQLAESVMDAAHCDRRSGWSAAPVG